jgi:hypothetical protein
MSGYFYRGLAAVATVAALTFTSMLGGASTASAAPCGLSGHYGATAPHVQVRTFYYTIRQCNNYTVWRKLNIARGRDGKCHRIAGNSQISLSITMPKFMSVRDKLKEC